MADMWDRLREAIRRNGTTQGRLCESLEWKPNRISKMKDGSVKLFLPDLQAMADALDVRLGWLIDGEPVPKGSLTPKEEAILSLARDVGYDVAIARLNTPVTPPTNVPRGKPSPEIEPPSPRGRRKGSA